MLLLWLLVVVCAAFFAGIRWYLRPLKPSIFRLQLCFTRDKFIAVLAEWQAPGIARFRNHFAADYLFIVFYGLLGYVMATRLECLAALTGMYAVLPCLLPLAAVCDVVENGLQQHLSWQQNAVRAPHALFRLAGLASTAKWLCIAAFFAVAAGACLF